MRRLAALLSLAALAVAFFNTGPRPAAAAPAAPGVTYPLPSGVRFVHVATGENSLAHLTAISHPASDDQPSALIFATHNYNPGYVDVLYNNRAVGVYYGIPTGRRSPTGEPLNDWWLINEDQTPVSAGLAYNLMVTPPGERTFIHTTAMTNTFDNFTNIDHPWLNGRLDRIPFVLHNFSPNGVSTGPFYTETVGVWYNPKAEQWSIFNETDAVMPVGASFNVMVGLPGVNVFTHTATISNTNLNATFLDHPLSNGRPNAVILVTQLWNPTGKDYGVYNPQHIGVYYDTGAERWAIYNEGGKAAPMPNGASFCVLISEVQVLLPQVLAPGLLR
jgi:hypothetical protein